MSGPAPPAHTGHPMPPGAAAEGAPKPPGATKSKRAGNPDVPGMPAKKQRKPHAGHRSAAERAASSALAEQQHFTSRHSGVSWSKQRCRWEVRLGKDHLGIFDDEDEAAKAFDKKARDVRENGKAHGGRAGPNWLRVNFPTAQEKTFAENANMPPAGRRTKEEKAAVAAKAEAQNHRSEHVGVCWNKKSCQWKAQLKIPGGKQKGLGYFNTEEEAAKAFDNATRQIRPTGEAHGGRSGSGTGKGTWLRLNFPTPEEDAFSKAQEMPPKKKRKAKAPSAGPPVEPPTAASSTVASTGPMPPADPMPPVAKKKVRKGDS